MASSKRPGVDLGLPSKIILELQDSPDLAGILKLQMEIKRVRERQDSNMGRLDELKKFYRDLNENMKSLIKEQDKALHQIMLDKSKPKMSKLDMGK